MYAKAITAQSEDLAEVQRLYVEAFPENERSPFELLLEDKTNCSEIFAFYEGEVFCGFMSVLSCGDISHIIYFAIDETQREKGYGSEALKLIKEIKPNNRILVDIEVPTASANNNPQRSKRKQFYIRNGYLPSGVVYSWRDDDYEILVNGGNLPEQDFWDFWKSVSKMNIEFAKF